jgi:hypothetical protein
MSHSLNHETATAIGAKFHSHYQWPSDLAESEYKRENPHLHFNREASDYDAKPGDKIIVKLKFSGSNWHYLVGR